MLGCVINFLLLISGFYKISSISQTSFELNKLRKDVADKASEIKRLQTELSRRESDEAGDTGSLKRVIARLEKENVELKVGLFGALYYLHYLMKVNDNFCCLNRTWELKFCCPCKFILDGEGKIGVCP